MKSSKRLAITLLCLLAALACYLFGVEAGGALFLILGVVFEGIFWARAFRRTKTVIPPRL